MTDTVLTVTKINRSFLDTSVELHVAGTRAGGADTVTLTEGSSLTITWPMDRSIREFIRELQKIHVRHGGCESNHHEYQWACAQCGRTPDK